MLKKIVSSFFLFSTGFASFSVGYSSYGTSWSTSVYSYQGTLTSYVCSLSSNQGPVAVFTFNIPQNNFNPYTNGLGALLFTTPNPIPQILYSTNNSLTQFQTQNLSSQKAVYYIESTGSVQRILTSFMNTNSGIFTSTPRETFPFQSYPFIKITSGEAQGNTCVVSALSGPYANSANLLYSKTGTINGFSQQPTSLVSPFSNPLFLAQTSTTNISTIAYCQNNYGRISTSYVLENMNGITEPVKLTDYNETGCQFINFNTDGNILFIADSTLEGTSRLGASELKSSGALTPFNFLTASYSYNSSIPLTFSTDSQNNQYIIFNGAATSYSNNNLQIGIYNSNTHKWQGFYTGPSLFISNTNPCQTTPFNKGLMLTELSNGLYFTQATYTNSSGQVTIGSTPTFITGYNISSCILNNTNFTFSTITTLNQTLNSPSSTITTISPFYTPPNYTSCVDSSNNVVFAFSGYTNYNNLIFSNVYINSSGNFTGQNLINGVYGSPTQGSSYPSITFYGTTTPPTAISPPTLVSYSGNIACIWSQNVGGIYTIYGAPYLPLKFCFGTPTQLATGFTSMPIISVVPATLGIIFAGNN